MLQSKLRTGRALFIASALALLSAAACSGGETSIDLRFPNEEARAATLQLEVFGFSRDMVGVQADDLRCSALLGRLANGEKILGDPAGAPLQPPFDGRIVAGIPSGEPVIFVVGYNEATENRKPILEGCTQDFNSGGNSTDVPIELSVIIPDETTLRKVGGDRQVGHPGQMLSTPLGVKVTGVLPGQRGEVYDIPGVELSFAPSSPLALPPSAPGVTRAVNTNASGVASAMVELPVTADQYTVTVMAAGRPMLGELTFRVSAIDEVSLRVSEEIVTNGAVGVPVAVALGNVSGATGGGALADIVVLGCAGTKADCGLGHDAPNPGAATRLLVVADVLGTSGQTSVGVGDIGIAPSGLVVGPLVPGAHDDVALVNARRRVAAGMRVSEGAEMLVFRGADGGPVLDARHALTASNAVGLVGYNHRSDDGFLSLLTAGQGRRVNDQPCRLDPSCLPTTLSGVDCAATPEMCGCPVNERCVCPPRMSCLGADSVGVCFPDDRVVDKLVNRHNNTSGGFENVDGCHRPVFNCDKPNNAQGSSCSCDDNPGAQCTGRDACFCQVPRRTLIGVAGSPRFPYGLSAGRLRRADQTDIVVASAGGLEFIGALGPSLWSWEGQPLVNDQANGVLIAEFDRDAVPDIAFFSKRPCNEFGGQRDPCPIVSRSGQAEGPGCVGVVLRGGVDQVDTVAEDGCRRFPTEFEPDSFCQGDFNADGGVDIALASDESATIAIYLGDGEGGLLSPPDTVELGAGRVGGPVACADLDGDRRDDLVVVDGVSGNVIVLRTGS